MFDGVTEEGNEKFILHPEIGVVTAMP